MDITGVTGISDSTSLEAEQAGEAFGSDELNKETFLTLLTTQMQNQDPLDPMANEEFVAQLAQFSSLEQQMLTNSMLESVYLGIASLNNASMASLIGTDVVAYGDGINYSGEGDVELHYDAATDAASMTLEIFDSEGNVIYSEELGAVEAGEGSVTWDGTDTDGQPAPEGEYIFKITGEDEDGESVEITEMIIGVVDEMDYSSGTPQPIVDGVTVELADIVRLTNAEDSSDADGEDSERERTEETDAAADESSE